MPYSVSLITLEYNLLIFIASAFHTYCLNPYISAQVSILCLPRYSVLSSFRISLLHLLHTA